MLNLLPPLFVLALLIAAGPGVPVNCTGCDLSGRDLHRADLSSVTYVGVDLSRANLRGANMRDAILIGVDFANADLRDADLRDAALCSYDSVGRVGCADFRGADVRGADLRGARVCEGARQAAGCATVDAATLRRAAHSNLDGALLQ